MEKLGNKRKFQKKDENTFLCVLSARGDNSTRVVFVSFLGTYKIGFKKIN